MFPYTKLDKQKTSKKELKHLKEAQNSCKIQNIQYSSSSYQEFDNSGIKKLAKPAKTHINRCFCNDSIPHVEKLPKAKIENNTSYLMNPMIQNLGTCDGLYSYRIYNRYNMGLLPTSHKFPHYFAIVSDNKFYSFSGYARDSLERTQKFEKIRKPLEQYYSSSEIDRIFDCVKYGTYYTGLTSMPPYRLIKDGVVLWEIKDNKKEN